MRPADGVAVWVPEFIARREQAVNEHGDSVLGLKFSFMQHFTLCLVGF